MKCQPAKPVGSAVRTIRPPHGFTVVELLVVVAILAVLLATVMPSLGRAKRLARMTVCISNVGQLSRAIELYAAENNQRYWLFYHGDNEYWIQKIEPYHDDADRLRLCPEATRLSYGRGTADMAWGPEAGGWMGDNYGSYGLNLWLTANDPDRHSYYSQFEGGGYKDWFWRSSTMTRGPVPTLCDSIWVGSWPFDNDPVPDNLYLGRALHYGNDLPASEFMGRFCIDRHMMAVCSGFVDGSARKIPLPELWLLQWSRYFVPTEIEFPPN